MKETIELEKVNGLTLEQWIAQETAPRHVSLWGEGFEFSPEICDKFLGDGKQLIYLGSIDQRPRYWLLRIDSKTDIEADDFDYESLISLVEECFGRFDEWISEDDFEDAKKDDPELEYYDTYEDYEEHNSYPRMNWGGGHWGLIVNMVTGETE